MLNLLTFLPAYVRLLITQRGIYDHVVLQTNTIQKNNARNAASASLGALKHTFFFSVRITVMENYPACNDLCVSCFVTSLSNGELNEMDGKRGLPSPNLSLSLNLIPRRVVVVVGCPLVVK